MKLLLLDQFSDPGGAQQGLLELLPAIRDRGWDALVGLPGDGELFERVTGAGFPVERIECGPYASGRKSAGDIARFLRGTPRLASQIHAMAAAADVVYVNGPRLLPAASLARLQAPVVFHAHSLVGPGMMRRIAGWALRRMNAPVLANCEFVAAPWRRYADEVSIVFNGVGPGSGPARVSSSDRLTVACIGRIAPEKGQLEFLDSVERIHKRLPDTRYVICGAALFGEPGAQSYDQEVRCRAADLPVEFAGWVDDAGAVLAHVDVLLVPSAGHEATTRVILEAYAAGVPVIAFASGGIPEVVDDGVTGCLTCSAEEMAAMTIELLCDRGRRAAMSAAAHECWKRRFTLERYQNDVLAALERARRPVAPDPPLPPKPAHIQAG
ncbi:MAG TPA: glycosyltransferase family 4 protein [Tepidisphaeraceae bacterium]|nr:glycosyltransferase family 4 protein [Tepidisphaeraceae bacterium]